MASATRSTTGGLDARVDDYLNDKLQTVADLDNLETLLQSVRNQQSLLKKQLDEAQTALTDAEEAAAHHAAAIQHKAQAFQQQQAEIDRQLMSLTQSETSDEASKKFAPSMEKLRRLEIASGYIDLLRDVDNLGMEACSSFKTSPRSALPPYARMRSLGLALKTAQAAAEDAAPHLIDQVAKHTSALYEDIKGRLEDDLRATLNQMAWPKKDLNLSQAILVRWTEQVELLLDLQKPDLQEKAEFSTRSTSSDQAPILLPLAVMGEPLVLRFRYHFYGEKPTNRLDKPEYFLSHILDLLDQHNDFLVEYVQPILDAQNGPTNLMDAMYTDAISAFISALMPVLTEKSLSLLSQISSQPQLLSHFVHELMSFDSTLKDSWGYMPVPDVFVEWRGLTWAMLNTHGYFAPWLKGEKDFALSRYRSIRDSPDGGDLDVDAADLRTTKPTKGAIRVNDLLETVTDRYRGLVSFSDKLKFLMDVQIAIFDDYHSYLLGALQSFIASSHTAGRLIQGQTKTDTDISGVKGLESLSKIFGSAEYLEDKMSDWSNDVFFLELWDELQDRARRNSGPKDTVGRRLAMEEVASKASSTINFVGEDRGDTDGGGLFDETASSYRRLKERTEAEIVRSLENNVRNSLKAFMRTSGWSSLSAASAEPEVLSPSASLDSTLQTISSQLGFLADVLAVGSLIRIARQVCMAIEKELYENLLLRNSFSTAGVAQFRRDFLALRQTIDASIKSPGRAQRSMRKLEQALTLLSLPVDGPEKEVDTENDDTGEWGFDNDGGAEQEFGTTNEAIEEEEGKSLNLRYVSRKVFESNESARTVLTSIDCDLLSESDARSILERRLEINN